MPKFTSSKHYEHGNKNRIGVLVTNLGTPDAPTAKALRPYLKQFLSDSRVVEIPKPIWWLILNGIILNTRPKKSAQAYKTIWTDEGSPLAVHTKNQSLGIEEKLNELHGDDIVVEWAMRYGNPSIDSGIESLLAKGARKILVFPLYPQYSASTTASTFDAIANDFTKRRWIPELRFISCYHDTPEYIDAIAQSITEYWQQHGRADKLIFSYHGVPKRYLHSGDPYHCQCHKTTRLVTEKLGLNENEYLTSFQSLFGKAEWLRPYTADMMKQMPKDGIKSVQVICPGFSSDCLETVEEIEEENKEYFMHAGGEKFGYIPALNSTPVHIDALTNIVQRHLQGWGIDNSENTLTSQLAKDHSYNQ